MATGSNSTEQEHQKPRAIHHGGPSEAVYGFGLIGACVYYFSHAATFWTGLLEFFKALVWPAMLVYESLKYLYM